MATEVLPTVPPRRMPSSRSAHSIDEQLDLSTLPDPRNRATNTAANGEAVAAAADGSGSPGHQQQQQQQQHPGLDSEVAALSAKLVNAINHQTSLGDTLSQTCMELDESLDRIRQLEELVAQQREMLAGDVWVRRKAAEADKSQLLSRIADEKRARLETEQQNRRIEQELEGLTAALFEEANRMVIAAKEEARREHDALRRRNDGLRSQLADAEGLLTSQQEQLAELKHVMEQMSDDRTTALTALTAPSSPGLGRFLTRDDSSTTSDGVGPVSHAAAEPPPVSPSHPTSFAHLVQPVLRTDLAAYDDFVVLVRTSKRLSASTPSSRPPSGTHSSFAALGFAGLVGSAAAASSSSSPLSNAAGIAPRLPPARHRRRLRRPA